MRRPVEPVAKSVCFLKFFQRQLEELTQALTEKQILGEVKVLTPLAAANHWRVSIITFRSGRRVIAQLWDPLATSSDSKAGVAYQNMQ